MELARPAVQLGTQQGAFILIFFEEGSNNGFHFV